MKFHPIPILPIFFSPDRSILLAAVNRTRRRSRTVHPMIPRPSGLRPLLQHGLRARDAGVRKDREKRPNDAFAVNHLLTAVLMHDLYDTGAMNTGDYANDSFIGRTPRPTDPKMKERIKDLVRRAQKPEEQQLKANPNDVDAIYCRGVTRAQFSVYTGLVERAWFSALRNAVGARHDHERVLEIDPNYVDAKLVVGTHNYVVGTLPWSVKVAAAIAGLSGSKDKGLSYLRDVANSDGENAVDAKVVLTLFLRREHQYDEALKYMQELTAKYPRNHLFPTEVANLERAAGRLPEAEASIARSGRTVAKGSTAPCITRWPHGAWETCCAEKGSRRRGCGLRPGQPGSEPGPRHSPKGQPGRRRNVRPAAETRNGHEEIPDGPGRKREHWSGRPGAALHSRGLSRMMRTFSPVNPYC